MKERILVTGGAGYIGSHTVVELLDRGYEVVVVDNLCNSSRESLNRIHKITGQTVPFYETDLRDRVAMDRVFSEHQFQSIIHFAGLKAVGESVAKPLEYYENNVGGTLCLLETALRHGVKKIVFSSSATVYGDPERLPIDENCRLSTTNPYGSTKLMIEQILTDVAKANKDFTAVLLRYFNPVGAHPSGLIGEDPKGIPNNLTPYIAQVASGKLPVVHVYGNDYKTPDGTGVRDYIHVLDLAVGHVLAIEKVAKPGVFVYNLGTGKGYSVLEVIRAFEKASGKKLPFVIEARRPGDIDASFADVKKAQKELGFVATRGIDEMCASLWKWQSMNPKGYDR
ncbi:MAG TPA: UDP-glucose 4-epimerase GalE [Candidatus Izemoplasmatales bacterium]|nr:UDP-glucose 4-epimerase GalE [Bacillota bacterium]HRY78182.1 UDP-glucose 4-epimerase GalE [Candidatus Izemoplasmatales bacterium]